jgi:hypothetical protein
VSSAVTCSLIGSFRQHYREVLMARKIFATNGLEVLSPLGSPILKDGELFVRFESDDPNRSDPAIQTIALHRILRSHFTYVVAPKGYVGRTTAYEIGRLVQASHSVYFSDHPVDLPIAIPSSHVRSPLDLLNELAMAPPMPLRLGVSDELEGRLLSNDYLDI